MINDILLDNHDSDIGIITHMMLKRGADLIQIKENQDYLGVADTFNEYLSQKDVRKDAKICMDLVNFYILHHRLQAEDIHDIHHDRLLEAMKAIKVEPDKLHDWLSLCRELSWKDLINAVRGVRGRAEMPESKPSTGEPPYPGSPCILHPQRVAENAHWPITEKMGGKFTLPLCRECHNELHTIGDVTFYAKYKRKIGEYLATLGEK